MIARCKVLNRASVAKAGQHRVAEAQAERDREIRGLLEAALKKLSGGIPP
jgi:hypothetical protein